MLTTDGLTALYTAMIRDWNACRATPSSTAAPGMVMSGGNGVGVHVGTGIAVGVGVGVNVARSVNTQPSPNVNTMTMTDRFQSLRSLTRIMFSPTLNCTLLCHIITPNEVVISLYIRILAYASFNTTAPDKHCPAGAVDMRCDKRQCLSSLTALLGQEVDKSRKPFWRRRPQSSSKRQPQERLPHPCPYLPSARCRQAAAPRWRRF